MKIKKIILISLTFLGLLLSPNYSRAGESVDTSVTSTTITVSGTISAPLLAVLQTPVTTTNPGAGLQICYGISTTTISNCSSTFYADNQSGNIVTIQNDGIFTYTISSLSPNTNYSIDVLRTDTGASILSNVLQAQTADTSVSLDPGATPAPTCTEGPDGYCLLAPISGLSVIHDTDLPNYFNLIYKIGIGLAAVLALIMLFFGGIQYMSTDALSGKTEGKKKMSNALLGLLLALGSYAILNTVNPKLLNFTFGIDSVSISINPDEIDNAIPSTPENGLYCPLQNNGQGYTDGSVWDQNLTADTALRSQLQGQNSIAVSGGGCAAVGQQNCTSLAGLNISGVLKIRDKCPTCELTITGGTECWLHSKKTAHGKNSTTIDLRNNASAPKLKAYVETAANLKGTISGWGKLYVVDGIEFVNEGDHYHVWGYNSEHAAKYPH